MSVQNSKHPCFINVMSWCKVSLPSEPDNVPLYGGVQIPLSDKYQVETKNGKCKPLVFAVMANPQFLKESGKSAPSIQVTYQYFYSNCVWCIFIPIVCSVFLFQLNTRVVRKVISIYVWCEEECG